MFMLPVWGGAHQSPAPTGHQTSVAHDLSRQTLAPYCQQTRMRAPLLAQVRCPQPVCGQPRVHATQLMIDATGKRGAGLQHSCPPLTLGSVQPTVIS